MTSINLLFFWFFIKFCRKPKFYNPYSFAILRCKPLIFQTKIIWSNRIQIFETSNVCKLGCKDKGSRNSEFVARTKYLWMFKNALLPCEVHHSSWGAPCGHRIQPRTRSMEQTWDTDTRPNRKQVRSNRKQVRLNRK